MFFGKKYKISREKKELLEKELLELETRGREEVASRLDLLRRQSIEEEDFPFADVLDDKEYLENRIVEIKGILDASTVIDDKEKHTVVEIGSRVKVGFENFEDEYVIVSSIEADPLQKKISDESPIGKSLLGAHIGDIVEVALGPVKKKFRIKNIS